MHCLEASYPAFSGYQFTTPKSSARIVELIRGRHDSLLRLIEDIATYNKLN